MNRTDRLLAVVLELQGREWVQAGALARTFAVSVRTIYRDVLALNEAGVPVLSVPGRGYSLMPGYFLPPLHFTVPEAVMLAFGADGVRNNFDAEYAGAAESALKKLLAALPSERREAVEALRAQIRLVRSAEDQEWDVLRPLRGALLDCRTVTFTYHKPGAEPEVRRVNPLGLVHLNGTWMLYAFDQARGEERNYRLDRLEALQVTPETFQRNPTVALRHHPERERREVTVRLRFPLEFKRWVQERPNFFQVAELETADGYEVALQVRDGQDVLPWLLSWGGDVRVLEPQELAERVRQEARRMLSAPTDSGSPGQ